MKQLVGLQLYSLRDDFAKDYKDTLKRVSELGFQGVEFAGFHDIPAKEMKETLDLCNLKAAGSHTSYELLMEDLDGVIEYNKVIGNKYITCPWCSFPNEEAFEEIVHNFNQIGKRLAEEGFTFSYHNHSHEFEKLGDAYIFDALFEACDVVTPELDVYWVYRGHENSVEYTKKYANAMNLLHLKDGNMETGTALGDGEVDILGVLETVAKTDIEWVIVEDETPYPNAFASVQKSAEYLKKEGYLN